MNDMVELDGTRYVCVPYFYPDEEALEIIKSSGCETYTFETLTEMKGSHSNLYKMWEAAGKYRSICECGAEAGEPHWMFCPAFRKYGEG